ncbi:MAG: type II toxin-antitoxin system VapC family toxin [Chloroflexota bacterium]|nr:MAG: type II toxin-antitoxin system VapC family toxin [Chloroflexota bacterium]
MSLIFLLDTNIVSEPMRPNPNRKTMAYLQQHEGEVAIASVVWHELLFGWQRLPKSAKSDAIGAYLMEVIAAEIPILSYDAQAAYWHANERARLTAAGRTPSFADGQIAAVATINDLTLVTANVSDYASFEGLQIENWTDG